MSKKIVLFFTFLFGTISTFAQNDIEKEKTPPEISREFRAAWVATVANINWPSEPGLSVEKQKEEAIDILDSLALFNFNAVIFQVRPQGDALYQSEIEPWSYFLTGEQGKAPTPFYDPLEFWLEESHKRGMELHVWLNPYRIHHIKAPKPSKHSMVYKLKDVAVQLKEGYWWLDPAEKITQEHTLNVVKDLVLRYDIDGVHFDDYFYPYESYNEGEDFPDAKSWEKYQKEGGLLSRKDWRRDAVNQFVRDVYYLIKSYKPFVKFGLSPFGIWRPNNPASIQGLDQYDKLYADAKKWLNYGWVDYFSPQLYWPINREAQSYPVLLQWWQSQNTHQRYIWPGINDYNAVKSERGADEIQSQIMINRGIAYNGPGVIHWSVGSLLNNDTLLNRLQTSVYRRPALIPALTWDAQDSILPKPIISAFDQDDEEVRLAWNEIDAHQSLFTALQACYEGQWETKILGEKKLDLDKLKGNKKLEKVRLSFIDRYGQMGEILEIEVK